jgi:F-type H+-transporting ATPase subunit b
VSHLIQDPTFWTATAFVAFILVLIYLKIPTTIGIQLDKRATKIKADLDQAEALYKESQDLLATYQKKQRDAAKEAEGIIDYAKTEAQLVLEQGRMQLTETLARREQLAKDRIAQAEALAIDDFRSKTVNVAMDATQDILIKELATTKLDRIIDAEIKDLHIKLK